MDSIVIDFDDDILQSSSESEEATGTGPIESEIYGNVNDGGGASLDTKESLTMDSGPIHLPRDPETFADIFGMYPGRNDSHNWAKVWRLRRESVLACDDPASLFNARISISQIRTHGDHEAEPMEVKETIIESIKHLHEFLIGIRGRDSESNDEELETGQNRLFITIENVSDTLQVVLADILGISEKVFLEHKSNCKKINRNQREQNQFAILPSPDSFVHRPHSTSWNWYRLAAQDPYGWEQEQQYYIADREYKAQSGYPTLRSSFGQSFRPESITSQRGWRTAAYLATIKPVPGRHFFEVKLLGDNVYLQQSHCYRPYHTIACDNPKVTYSKLRKTSSNYTDYLIDVAWACAADEKITLHQFTYLSTPTILVLVDGDRYQFGGRKLDQKIGTDDTSKAGPYYGFEGLGKNETSLQRTYERNIRSEWLFTAREEEVKDRAFRKNLTFKGQIAFNYYEDDDELYPFLYPLDGWEYCRGPLLRKSLRSLRHDSGELNEDKLFDLLQLELLTSVLSQHWVVLLERISMELSWFESRLSGENSDGSAFDGWRHPISTLRYSLSQTQTDIAQAFKYARKHSSQIQDDLLIKLTDVLEECGRLQERTERVSQAVMSNMSILESRKAISEAENVARLTELAFVFIPMSFVASYFGMEVDWDGIGKPKLWVFWTVSVCLLLFLYAIRVVISWKEVYERVTTAYTILYADLRMFMTTWTLDLVWYIQLPFYDNVVYPIDRSILQPIRERWESIRRRCKPS